MRIRDLDKLNLIWGSYLKLDPILNTAFKNISHLKSGLKGPVLGLVLNTR